MTKSFMLRVRMSDDEAARLAVEAKSAGVSVSALVRGRVFGATSVATTPVVVATSDTKMAPSVATKAPADIKPVATNGSVATKQKEVVATLVKTIPGVKKAADLVPQKTCPHPNPSLGYKLGNRFCKDCGKVNP